MHLQNDRILTATISTTLGSCLKKGRVHFYAQLISDMEKQLGPNVWSLKE